jgi:hypothetical protein
MSKAAAGPFTDVATVSPRSLATYNVTGLKPKTKYFFRIVASTPAHAGNANALRAEGAVFSATTKK